MKTALEILEAVSMADYTGRVVPNRFKGRCNFCLDRVEEQEGFYLEGSTYCYEVVFVPNYGFICSNKEGILEVLVYNKGLDDAKRIAAEARMEAVREENKVARTEKQVEIVLRNEELDATGQQVCPRCGGAGRSDNWYATGYECFGCGGSGIVLK